MAASAIGLTLIGITTIALLTAGPASAQSCASGATDTWNGNAGDGNWNTAGNWSTGAVPGAADFACIPASTTGTVTISGLMVNGGGDVVLGVDAEGSGGLAINGTANLQLTTDNSTINNLNLSAGTLIVNQSATGSAIVLTLTGTSSWTGGVISGGFISATSPIDSQTTVAPGATLTIAGTATSKPIQSMSTGLINEGTLNWTAGDFCAFGDGVENASGGTFTMSASDSVQGLNATVTCLDSSPGPNDGLRNDAGGTLIRSGGAGTTERVSLPLGFINSGTLEVSTILQVNGAYASSASSSYDPVLSGSGPAGSGFGFVTATTQTASGSSPGTIAPTTSGGFAPANGESFAVIGCGGSCGGGFPTPGNGFTVQNDPNDITVVGVAGASAAPNPVNFGTELVGSSTALTETLTNPGSGVLTVRGVTIAGTNPNDFFITSNGCSPAGTGTTIGPGASCTVRLSFDPAATGNRSATLTFTDDAATSPQTVSLVGSGTTTPASVIPPPSPSPSPSPASSPTPSPTASGKAKPKPTPTPTATATPAATATAIPAVTPTGTVTPPPPAPPAPGSPLFTAVSPKGLPYGPAGSGLNTAVLNYPAGCTTVYFFFDGVRIGSAPVDSAGHADAKGLSVPGNAKPGRHTVTSSCAASAAPIVAATSFRVTAGLHRAAFDTALNNPAHIDLTPTSFALSAAISVAVLALVAFPSQIFNATLQEHYEEVRGWFHLKRPLAEVVKDVNQRVLFPIFLLVGGVLFALITPDFGFNRSTLALVLGLAIAVGVVTVGFAVPTFIYFLDKYKDRGQILVMPGSVIVGIACVGVSRLLHFEPGYLYGLLAIFVFHHETDEKTDGRLAAASAALVILLAVVTWVARVPLTGLNEKNPSFIALVAESALGGAFVIGVESVLVGLLPMRFLDGSRIRAWNRWVWLGLFLLGIFVAVQILIQPGTGYVGHTSVAGRFTVLSLYLAFCAVSVGFWAYFRYRKPKKGEEELDTEGDYGVR